MEVIILIATLIFVAAFMFGLFCIGDMGKDKEPRNKVRFFVTKDYRCFNNLQLWLGRPKWDNYDRLWVAHSPCVISLSRAHSFKYFKLNPDNFADMKEGQIREVFINLED